MPVDGGTVTVRGRQLGSLSADELAQVRRDDVGTVFQFGDLIPELTLVDNVSLPLRFAGWRRGKALDASRTALKRVGIEELSNRLPGEVSGGQMLRAALARAIVAGPAVVLADEPTGALDTRSGAEIVALIKLLAATEGVAFLIGTHDEHVASEAGRILHLVDGRLVPVASAVT